MSGRKWRGMERPPHMLPLGRHGLSREFVASNQRDRLLAAVATVCHEVGYARLSTERIARAAGVSRFSLYEHYPQGKPDVFLAALCGVTERLLEEVFAAVNPVRAGRAQARAGIKAVFDFAASEPAAVGLVAVEALAADDQARAYRQEFVSSLGELLAGDRSIRTTVWSGGVFEIVQSHVRAGLHAELPGVLPEVVAALRLAPAATAKAGSR